MRPDKELAALPIKTALKEGESYVDEPVIKQVPVYCAKEPMNAEILSHYRRVPLRWMKPAHGKLVPR